MSPSPVTPTLTLPADPGKVRIAPSILSADFAYLGDDINRVRPEADVLHVDVMDGHFVPNLTIGPPVVTWIRRHCDLYLDCHLMMDNPAKYLEAFRDAGANGCTVHVEIGGTGELIAQMRELGLGVGVAVNPETSFELCEPWLDRIDLLLVMTVHPGFGGQSFMTEVVPKISRAREAIDALGAPVNLEVDGGVDYQTAPIVAMAGARVLVAGSAIFGQDDPVAAARRIRQAAEAALADPSASQTGHVPGPGGGS
jgi:ribulose-phosphate 3-epimerase